MRRMQTRFLSSLAGLTLLAAPAAAWALDFGDPAPPLKIDTWVQGKALSLEEERDKSIVVVNFFGSMCQPAAVTTAHLGELHRKYQDHDVKFVSVCGDGADWIEMSFLPRINAPLDFRLAHDDQYQTTIAYLAAAGAKFVPYAFIVDRAGRVAWHGTPDQRIDEVIEAILADRYDMAAEKERRIRRQADWKTLVHALNDGHLDEVASRLATLEPLESQEALYLSLRYTDAMKADDVAAATLLGKVALTLEDRPQQLNDWAWNLLTAEGLAGRYAELALHVAKKAYAAAGPDEYAVADTLALAYFQTGQIQEAVTLQRHAVELAEKNHDKNIDSFRTALKRYEQAAGSED